MTQRQIANRVRQILSDIPGIKVKGKTVSFSGFGYDDGFFVEIHTPTVLPDTVKDEIRKLGHKANDGTTVVYQMRGPDYPFGGTIK